MPEAIESAPRLAPTVRSSITVSLAGSAPDRSSHGKVVRLRHGEVAADLTGAAEDRLANDRRRNHFAVEHDGEGQADILLRRPGEALGAGGVEAEGHDRLAGALIEARLRVDQVLAAHQHLLLNHVRDWAGCPWSRPARRRAGTCLVSATCCALARGIDQLEFELAGLADELLQPLDVADAGNLHEHAVAALALDARLGGAEGVDAAADGLDRGLNGRVHALGQAGVGDLEQRCRRRHSG